MIGGANEYLTLIDDCETRDSRLSDWERTFLDSIRNRIEAGGSLSQRQIETLEKVWEKVTLKG